MKFTTFVIIAMVLPIGQTLGQDEVIKVKTPAIDQEYIAQVGDKALLGLQIYPDAFVGETAKTEPRLPIRISSVFGYSSVAQLRQWLESWGSDEVIATGPDGYILRSCTPVNVKKVQIMVKYGERKEVSIAKVQVLAGEHKGKELYVLNHHVIRFIAGEAPPSPAPKLGKKRTAKQSPPELPAGTKLVLTDLVVNRWLTNDYLKVDGRIRCLSTETLRYVKVTISFEDRTGKLVRSINTYCDPRDLSAGETTSFSVTVQNDLPYASVKVSLKDTNGNVAWVDQSGTNAHE